MEVQIVNMKFNRNLQVSWVCRLWIRWFCYEDSSCHHQDFLLDSFLAWLSKLKMNICCLRIQQNSSFISWQP